MVAKMGSWPPSHYSKTRNSLWFERQMIDLHNLVSMSLRLPYFTLSFHLLTYKIRQSHKFVKVFFPFSFSFLKFWGIKFKKFIDATIMRWHPHSSDNKANLLSRMLNPRLTQHAHMLNQQVVLGYATYNIIRMASTWKYALSSLKHIIKFNFMTNILNVHSIFWNAWSCIVCPNSIWPPITSTWKCLANKLCSKIMSKPLLKHLAQGNMP